jgi:hypothetical protein
MTAKLVYHSERFGCGALYELDDKNKCMISVARFWSACKSISGLLWRDPLQRKECVPCRKNRGGSLGTFSRKAHHCDFSKSGIGCVCKCCLPVFNSGGGRPRRSMKR